MVINKSYGVTDTERMLAEFCERSFLKLWSYPNPYKDDGHELCDLLAVFGEYVFIFFDRENQLPEAPDKDPQILWDRWKRNVVDRQVKTAASLLMAGKKLYVWPAEWKPLYNTPALTSRFDEFPNSTIHDLRLLKVVVADPGNISRPSPAPT